MFEFQGKKREGTQDNISDFEKKAKKAKNKTKKTNNKKLQNSPYLNIYFSVSFFKKVFEHI